MKKIMVAIDGSEHAERALQKAISITASPEESSIDLVYVVDGDKSKSDVLHYGDSDTARYKREKMLEKNADIARQKGIQVSIEILHGDPAETLISFANSKSYDLVLVGSRGRNKLQTMLLGSVSHKLVKYIDAPVMVVK
ncbi:universal stress protein [Jeotgalibacillus campisalis]|uniref:Universal stress protein n=1 Tax=Jeotgalibacillus campisalis TaxID=220754 RepID=A0A0C2RLN6_9BACL|nr:universal stress protein [Jeotgalibacillus campisalis]KIL51165.1 universal stress protein [Jeotgalibacillus campisalis]